MTQALINLSNLIKRATEGRIVEGHHIQVAETVLESGLLICSLRYRSANSRGANRGKGRNVRFAYKTHDQQYAKDISKARALEILKAEEE